MKKIRKTKKKSVVILCVLIAVIATVCIINRQEISSKLQIQQGDIGITKIESSATLTIPKTTKGIGWYQYENKGITSLIFEEPSELEVISRYSFRNNQIKELEIPDSVIRIEQLAFANNPIEQLKLGKSINEIESDAFSGNNLDKIEIPDSVKKIGDAAFSNNKCEEIHIPESVQSIGWRAFSRNTSMVGKPYDVYLYNENLSIGKDAFCEVSSTEQKKDLTIYGYYNSTAEAYAISNGIKFEEIGGTKKGKYKINYVTIENQTLKILETIVDTGKVGEDIYAEIKTIDGYSFDNTDKNNIIYGTIPENGMLVLTLYYIPAEFQIDQNGGLTVNTKRTELEIPDRVNNIPVIRLKKINNLDGQKITKINFTDNINIIGDEALKDIGVIEMNIPSTLTEIGDRAFEGSGFEDVTLAVGVKKIGNESFSKCYNLKNVTIFNKNLNIGSDAFEKTEELVIKCFTNSTAYNYAIENEIKYELMDADEEDKYEISGDGALIVRTKKTELEIPDKVYVKKEQNGDEIKEEGLEEQTEDEKEERKVLKIRKVENVENQEITKITFPDGITEIQDEALQGIGLEEMNFPNSLKKFGKRALEGCKFDKIKLGETIEEIGDECFKGAPLTEVSIYNKDLKIGENAFDRREDLVIYGYNDSTAKQYANENGITFRTFNSFIWGEDNYNFGNWGTHYVSKYYYDEDGNVISDNGYEIQDKYFQALSVSQRSIINNYKARSPRWFGSCVGMQMTTVLFKDKKLTYNYWQEDGGYAETQYHLSDVSRNPKLKSLINVYQALQYFSGTYYINKGNSTSGLYYGVEEYYKNHDDGLLLLDFGYSTNWGHSIVITGAPEKGSYHDGRYTYRIPIYDNGYPNNRYLYFDEYFSNYMFGTDTLLESDYGNINWFSAYEVDTDIVFNLEKSVRKDESISIDTAVMEYDTDVAVEVKNKDGKNAKVKGLEKTEGNLECEIRPILGEETIGKKSKVSRVNAILPNEDLYIVETQNENDQLDTCMYFGDSYLSAKTENGGKAIFENKKKVKLTNSSGKKYKISMAVNEEYAIMPWYTVEAAGEGAKDVQVENTSEGTVISGDNLTNLEVKGNNIDETVELNAGTNKGKVLISANADKTKMRASIDNDENGTYETVIAEAEPKKEKKQEEKKDEPSKEEKNQNEQKQGQEDNTRANQKLPNTGVKTVILIVIGILVVLAIIFKVKSKIK